MRRPSVCSGMPDAHEVFAASMDEHGYWSVGLVMDDAEILTLWIDRPSLHFRKPMRCGIAHGVLNLRIVPNLDGGIVPPIETMAYIASITQRDMRSEEHTSELQSPDHLVCRLLLEKKKEHSQRVSRKKRQLP